MDNNESYEMNLSGDAREHLEEAARWAKFLAICGLIGVGLLVLLSISLMLGITGIESQLRTTGAAANVSAEELSGAMSVSYLLVGLIYFFPCLFMLQFANKMKWALESDDSLLLSESFRSLKKTFRFMAVVTIVILTVTLIGVLTGGFAG